MPTRSTPFPAGTPCWVDVLSSDVERSTAFYSRLFGWTSVAAGPDYGGYVTFHSDGLPVAGLTHNTGESDAPDGWTTYISTDDAAATVAAAAQAGAQVMMPAAQVAELGSMALLSDPAGAAFGLWQAGSHTGFQRYNEPGSVTWDEYNSKEFVKTTPFYQHLFGWVMDTSADTDAFRYYQAQVAGESVAGLFDAASVLPPEVPSHWAVYFSVVDVDAAVSQIEQLGGSVIRPAEDTPFGRIAQVNDPTGAAFSLHGPTIGGPTES